MGVGAMTLAAVPLAPQVREGSDQGHPIVLTQPESPAAGAFRQAAKNLMAQADAAASGSPQPSAFWRV
jgi:ATP-binding protein involved in chromosome partitioning